MENSLRRIALQPTRTNMLHRIEFGVQVIARISTCLLIHGSTLRLYIYVDEKTSQFCETIGMSINKKVFVFIKGEPKRWYENFNYNSARLIIHSVYKTYRVAIFPTLIVDIVQCSCGRSSIGWLKRRSKNAP